jgi:hypothetical protein
MSASMMTALLPLAHGATMMQFSFSSLRTLIASIIASWNSDFSKNLESGRNENPGAIGKRVAPLRTSTAIRALLRQKLQSSGALS